MKFKGIVIWICVLLLCIGFLYLILNFKHFYINIALLKHLRPRIYNNDEFTFPLPYRLLIPNGYTNEQTYPLILILHGGSERGTDNKSQITPIIKNFIGSPVQDISKTFVLFPQCPKNTQWLNTQFNSPPFSSYIQEDIPESESMKMIIQIIYDLLHEFPIDENRIYVTGYSMGGSGTWDIITRYPSLFAAAVPITGVSDYTKANVITDLPIWAFHGTLDTITPVEVTQKMIQALKKNGSDCLFTYYENVGHNSWIKAYNEQELFDWMFKQSRN